MQITLAVATIVAILLGPIVALWIQRNSEKRREKRNRKLIIFKELMATRATTLSPRHVDALNAIEVEFSKGGGKGEKLVLDTWRLYLEHLNTSGTLSGDQLQRWVERKLELLIDLLYEMSRALQYDFDKVALKKKVPLRDRCSFGRFPCLISQALSMTYMAGERRLYLERNCRLPESPAHSRRRNREGPASSKGLNSQRGFGPAVEPRRKSRPRSTSLHGSSPCKCQRLSTLRWDRLPPRRPSTKSGARAGGRRLSDRRLHRWLAGTSASAPSSHGTADLLGLNRAHICVRNQEEYLLPSGA